MSITAQDLSLVEQIIRICQSRGAFTPGEMKDVGTLYEKVLKILKEIPKEQAGLPSIPEETPEENR